MNCRCVTRGETFYVVTKPGVLFSTPLPMVTCHAWGAVGCRSSLNPDSGRLIFVRTCDWLVTDVCRDRWRLTPMNIDLKSNDLNTVNRKNKPPKLKVLKKTETCFVLYPCSFRYFCHFIINTFILPGSKILNTNCCIHCNYTVNIIFS